VQERVHAASARHKADCEEGPEFGTAQEVMQICHDLEYCCVVYVRFSTLHPKFMYRNGCSTQSRADEVAAISLMQMDFIAFQNPAGICFVNVLARLLGLQPASSVAFKQPDLPRAAPDERSVHRPEEQSA
jgi:hypothetical protein